MDAISKRLFASGGLIYEGYYSEKASINDLTFKARRNRKHTFKGLSRIIGTSCPALPRLVSFPHSNHHKGKLDILNSLPDDKQLIFIRHIFTHAEYDKGSYKDDCNC